MKTVSTLGKTEKIKSIRIIKEKTKIVYNRVRNNINEF